MAGLRRSWEIDYDDYETDEDAHAAVEQDLALLRHMGDRLGLGFVAVPKRQRVNGEHITTGWIFRSEGIPSVEAGEPESEPEIFIEPGSLEDNRSEIDETPESPDPGLPPDDKYAETA